MAHTVGVFFHDALVYTHAREGVDVARLGESDHWVDKHILNRPSLKYTSQQRTSHTA
jgi:hypothetical protein